MTSRLLSRLTHHLSKPTRHCQYRLPQLWSLQKSHDDGHHHCSNHGRVVGTPWSHIVGRSYGTVGTTPRRAFMYVPASERKKIDKASQLGADCVVIDCEDAVAVNMKDTGRENVFKVLSESVDFGRSELAVRINDLNTGMAERDLEAAFTPDRIPKMINLPKVQEVKEVDWYFDRIRHRHRPDHAAVALTIMIETALGFVNMKDIIARARDLSDHRLRMEAVVFGYDDFAASVECLRSSEITEMMAARQMFVVYAKAFHMQAIDAVFTNYRDENGLRRQSLEGFNSGFNGKQVIHPDQITIVHECFTPSEDRIEWARQLVQEFSEHQKSGEGAFTFRGKMVDMPIYLQAKSILHIADSMSKA